MILESDARRSAYTETDIVPVLVATLDSDLRLIGEAIRHAGGTLLRAEAFWQGIDTRQEPDGSLAGLVAGAISLPGPGGRRQAVQVTRVDSRTRATYAPEEGSPENEGSRTLLGLVTALFDESLTRHQLAAIAFSEAQLDHSLKRAVWNLLRALRGRRLGSLRTLVVLVGAAELDVPLHCQPDVSVRYGIVGGRLITRDPWETSQVDIHKIATEDAPYVVLFLGAGASASSGLPLGNSLRDRALESFLGASAEEPEVLARRFHRYVESKDRLLPLEHAMEEDEFVRLLTLERVLREELSTMLVGKSPTLAAFRNAHETAIASRGPGVRALQDIVEFGRKVVICTVNFDQLIEKGKETLFRVLVTDDDFRKAKRVLSEYLDNDGPCPLLKLHGSIDAPESIVATVDRTALGLSGAKHRALELLASGSAGVPWTYIGYSMRDPDVAAVLRLPQFAAALSERWVMPHSESTVEKFADEARAQQWRQASLSDQLAQRTITISADAFLTELHRLWTA